MGVHRITEKNFLLEGKGFDVGSDACNLMQITNCFLKLVMNDECIMLNFFLFSRMLLLLGLFFPLLNVCRNAVSLFSRFQ